MAKKKEEGGTAFPGHGDYADQGMTLRDYFAGQALVGLLGVALLKKDGEPVVGERDFADASYRFADAMIAERATQRA